MNKEVISSIINALKTLEDISRRRNDSMIKYYMMQNDINRILVNYMNEMFSKINNDLKTLMKKVLEQKGFENYSVNLDHILEGIFEKTKDINVKIERSATEFQLSNKDLQDRIMDFDFILKEIESKLKE